MRDQGRHPAMSSTAGEVDLIHTWRKVGLMSAAARSTTETDCRPSLVWYRAFKGFSFGTPAQQQQRLPIPSLSKC